MTEKRQKVFFALNNMNISLQVAGLYSFEGIAKLADTESLKLSYETNRAIMCEVISKIGVHVGQKIAVNRKHYAKFSVLCALCTVLFAGIYILRNCVMRKILCGIANA